MDNVSIVGVPFFTSKICNQMKQKRYLYRKATHCMVNEEEWFWDELSDLSDLTEQGFCKYNDNPKYWEKYCIPTDAQSNWQKMKGEKVVGEVYSQYIGEVQYKYSTHVYSWMCVMSANLAISEHGHDESFVENGKKYIRRTKEVYAFCNTGKLEICGIGEKHCLINDIDEPMFVVSCKIVPVMRIRKSYGH